MIFLFVFKYLPLNAFLTGRFLSIGDWLLYDPKIVLCFRAAENIVRLYKRRLGRVWIETDTEKLGFVESELVSHHSAPQLWLPFPAVQWGRLFHFLRQFRYYYLRTIYDIITIPATCNITYTKDLRRRWARWIIARPTSRERSAECKIAR